jgi:hypothetical protein
MDRMMILDKATKAVSDREGSYGSPKLNYDRAANLINSVLDNTLNEPLCANDVVMIMCCIKLARLIETPDHEDSMVDLAGYAAIMSEVV